MSDAAIGTRARSHAATARNRKLVALWLFTLCFMIWVMTGIGGFTREAGAGLSIMNWDPVIGTLPPLSTAAWNRVFGLYQSIPQAKILHPGIDLAGFKTLFWPEYVHRLWGRLIGVVLLVPLLGFIATRRIEPRLVPWLVLLFLLGGLQGAIGWFMVASGFDADSVAVEPWRLALHFSAAMLLYTAVLWTALTVLHPAPAKIAGARGLRYCGMAGLATLALSMLAGSFVAGTHAIGAFDPAHNIGMGAPPPGYTPATMFASKAAILFNHQALAGGTLVSLLGTVVLALRGRFPPPVRDAGLAIGGLVILQFILGATALVSRLMLIGVAHQMNAVLLLTAILVLLHRLRAAGR